MVKTELIAFLGIELLLLISLVPAGMHQFKLDRRFGSNCGKIGIVGFAAVLLIFLEGHLEMLCRTLM
jgi:hypothetical protein